MGTIRNTLNPFTGKSDQVTQAVDWGVNEPGDPQNGDLFLNVTTGALEVFFNGVWYVITTLSATSISTLLLEDGNELEMEDSTDTLALDPLSQGTEVAVLMASEDNDDFEFEESADNLELNLI